MRAYLRALGECQHYLGSERLQVDLPDGASLLLLNGKVDSYLNSPLVDGQEVMLLEIGVGG